MKLIVAGSRNIHSYDVVKKAIIASGMWAKHKSKLEIVSGTANGVDKLGEEFATRNGLTLHRFPAEWDQFGKAAGAIRNCEMLNFVKDEGGLVAVWNGSSRGTKHMIEVATEAGIFVYVHKHIPINSVN